MNYLCMNLSKRTQSYSTRVRVKYNINFNYLTRVKTWLIYLKTHLIFDILTRGRVTQPRSINSTTWLRLDFGHRLLVFASMMNLESGPCFANICKIRVLWYCILQVKNVHVTKIVEFWNWWILTLNTWQFSLKFMSWFENQTNLCSQM